MPLVANCAEPEDQRGSVKASVASDVGRVRETNEDAYCLCQLMREDHPLLVAVADGMGGHMAGEVAAQSAIGQLRSSLEQWEPSSTDYAAALVGACAAANRAVFEAGQGGMGTTLTVALVVGSCLWIAHVGDSRAYLVRHNELRQLTHDHSLVGLMVKNGELGEQEAMQHPHRHLLVRALGTEPEVTVDLTHHTVQTGDIIVLCTDGLTSLVNGRELLQALTPGATWPQAASLLVDLANARGGTDNVTVLAVGIQLVLGEETS